jgi:hypothetical protein
LSTSSVQSVTSTRVVVDDGRSRTVIRTDMSRLARRAREHAVRRRGRSVGHAHRAIGGQLLGTVVRHALALSASVLALMIAMIGSPFLAGLVPSVGPPVSRAVAQGAAWVVAVDLPPVVPATQVEDLATPSAALGSKAFLLQRAPAPERASPRSWPPSAG